MKFKRLKRTPLLIATSVLALVSGLCWLHVDFLKRLEWMTYDLRVRSAARFPAPMATNLAFVEMGESSIAAIKSGDLGYRFGLLWPRQIYGRVVHELAKQDTKVVGFDVLFGELRPDHPPVLLADGFHTIESDQFFADEIRCASNVVLASTPDLVLPPLFATNAFALGDIQTEKDADGILRRAKAFIDIRVWHPLFRQAATNFDLDLSAATFASNQIILPQINSTNVVDVPVDADNNFKISDFAGDNIPPGISPKAKAFTTKRIWHMGIVLAAKELNLDLSQSTVDLSEGKIVLHGANGLERTIPVDKQGFFLVDWRISPNDPRILRIPIENLLWQYNWRLEGKTNRLSDSLRGRIVVVGSSAQGNDLTDRGATPLERDTLLVSKHWNIANSIITGQFIRRSPMAETIVSIILLGLAAAFVTWQFRAIIASAAIFAMVFAYIGFSFYVFVEHHISLSLVLPVLGVVMEHVSLVTYRVVFEEREQRRVKSVFSRIVSPEVVDELLGAEKLSLGGLRREMTVLFADVRGFTTFTDQTQEQVAEFVHANQLDTVEAEKCFDESARETLETVNHYLAAVADAVKKHGGTLDKYIGDCVMAFWNAPMEDDRHSLKCVKAAIDAQRAIYMLNQRRLAQNTEREVENITRAHEGLPPKPMLVALQLGTGINTGSVTVGLMGSNEHILNYTVFGREVNLASRLEGVSGSGRIIISETTFQHLLRDDPKLAATCVELPPVTVKGIRNAVRIYEVPWQQNK